MTEQKSPNFQIRINLDGVVAPAQRAAVICKEVVDFYFAALEKEDLSKAPENSEADKYFKFGFEGTAWTAEQRMGNHQTWILAKAFQDLMRGVRASLEEAYFVIQLMAAGPVTVQSASTLDNIVRPYRDKAAGMKFPQLLEAVNAALDKPLEFSDAYRSMQAARNCFEHRNGVVGQADVQPDGKMTLQFPRLKAFIERDGAQVELQIGMRVEAGELIAVKRDLRQRDYLLGQQLAISVQDFNEITFACSQVASELGQNLSKKFAPQASEGA